MTRLSAPAQVIRRLAVVSFALLAMACRAPSVHDAPDRKNPLPAGADPDPVVFRKNVSAFPIGVGHTRGRDAKCFLGFCKGVQVRIEAVGNTLLIDPKNPSATGVPVAHLVNTDDEKTELHYGLKPHTEAEYYLWVDKDTITKKARWTLLEVPIKGDRVLAAKPKELKLCYRRVAGEAKASEADFAEHQHGGKCSDKIASAATTTNAASVLSFQSFLAAIDHLVAIAWEGWGMQGGWIDCSNGCCT
jgi:hypothetical protein